jgi:hypothetical protein
LKKVNKKRSIANFSLRECGLFETSETVIAKSFFCGQEGGVTYVGL